MGRVRLIVLGAWLSILLAWRFDRIRQHAVLSLSEIVFFRNGKVLWRLPYDDLVVCTGSWVRNAVVLQQKGGKRRKLPVWRRKDQTAVISAIDDVLARYRTENEVHSPTRAAGFSPRDRAAPTALPQREE